MNCTGCRVITVLDVKVHVQLKRRMPDGKVNTSAACFVTLRDVSTLNGVHGGQPTSFWQAAGAAGQIGQRPDIRCCHC